MSLSLNRATLPLCKAASPTILLHINEQNTFFLGREEEKEGEIDCFDCISTVIQAKSRPAFYKNLPKASHNEGLAGKPLTYPREMYYDSGIFLKCTIQQEYRSSPID